MPSRPVLPLAAPVEIRDPQAALGALAGLRFPFLLHSALPGPRARWSFFGADPFAVRRGEDYEDACARFRRIARQVGREDPDALHRPAPGAAPFTGGLVGYWAYDLGRRFERLPSTARDDLGLPDALLGFYDVVGAYDQRGGRAWLFSSGLPLEGPRRVARARRRLDGFLRLLARGPRAARRAEPGGPPGPSARPARGGLCPVRSTFTPEAYRMAIEAVKDRIRAGDIFQANLSQRWTCEIPSARPTARALALAAALARLSPAPHAAMFGAPDHAVASASPERFLLLSGGQVETRPIKGTRPRSSDPVEDRRLGAELLASGKDRAENVMIVDVLRNDLGRVCETGSVRTTGLCELETFAHVHHLTSTVGGTLRQGLDAFDLLRACFPGGSITGAPKIRAMEILEGLEPVRRHVYTGSLGYLDWRGDADWSIAIRTALVTPAAIHFGAGGGITAESDPDEEYRETLHKAEGLARALESVAGAVRLAPLPAGVS